MRWLHFSDFHIGRSSAPEREAVESIVGAVKGALANNPGKVDAIFLVGDLAYSGKESDFQQFDEQFLAPLLKLEGLESAKIFAVPGNHDVDCDIGYPLNWGSMRRFHKTFFGEDKEGRKIRADRATAFKAFCEYIVKRGIRCPDPNKNVSELYIDSDLPCNIIATNTSFFSDKDEKSSNPITPCPLTSLRDVVGKIQNDQPTLLLGHHHLPGFLPDQQEPFKNFLVEKKLLYLHGHEHRPRLDFNRDGSVRLIGFGASYASALADKTDPIYRNSFAMCDLGEKLTLSGFAWDPDNGRWIEATSSQFSTGYAGAMVSGRPLELDLPSSEVSGKSSKKSSGPTTSPTLRELPRKSPNPSSVIPLPGISEDAWMRFIRIGRFVTSVFDPDETLVTSEVAEDGRAEVVMETHGQRDLLICIPSLGHIMGDAEVEAFNTRLDTEDYSSITVLSFGKLSSDAKGMYLRLKEKKHLEILANSDLADEFSEILTLQQLKSIEALEPSVSRTDVVVYKDDVFLLVIESRGADRSFFLVSKSGHIVQPNDPVVMRLREVTPILADLQYAGEKSLGSIESDPKTFEERSYRDACYEQANQVRYSSLSNIGLRPEQYTLKNIYIDANASEVDDTDSTRFDQIVDDHLETFPISEAIKGRIKKGLLSGDQQKSGVEATAARESCQKHGAVLLTGDPGSGKTCFVKNEILEYCKKTAEGCASEVNWYSEHIPIFVPLSQLVSDRAYEEKGFLEGIVVLLQKRGLGIDLGAVIDNLNLGRIALFFDGLDEIVSVEKRAAIVQEINELVKLYLPVGNRFVVTSRPAAINVVNLLPTMHRLALQGLTEGEISQLAARILSLRVAEGTGGVVVDQSKPRIEDSVLVNQLIADCREKKGVARLAQNPLLLTLLVMIYANAGAPAAKRHAIYDEAIKTLAAARQREAGHEPVSVQDLRERLGKVALSVYKKESGLLPTKDEVVNIVKSVMEEQRGEAVGNEEVVKFLQKVAESTGLIAISSNGDDSDKGGNVTFMHHSFLEYFAAWALCKDFESLDLKQIVREPRWHEVLTLVAGIVGESKDAAPVIRRILESPSLTDCVDSRDLLFAMECALESDVPSEGAVRAISSAVCSCLLGGACRVDRSVNERVGDRLGLIWVSAGGSVFEVMLLELLESKDDDVVAAASRMIGCALAEDASSPKLIERLESLARSGSDVVLGGICAAAARSVKLRTPEIRKCVVRALKGGTRLKIAAFEALVNMPGLSVEHWSDIINGLDDDDPTVSRLAGACAIHAGLNTDLIASGDAKRNVLVRAFEAAERSVVRGEDKYSRIGGEAVDRLLDSGLQASRILGIRLLSFVDREPERVRDSLFEILTSDADREESVAALNAMRWSPEVQFLCRLKELRVFVAHLEKGNTDVRAAAIRLLGCFHGSAEAMKALLAKDPKDMAGREYLCWVGSVSRSDVIKDQVALILSEELRQILKSGKRQSPEMIDRFIGVLDGITELGEALSANLGEELIGLVTDFRVDLKVRGAAARTCASCVAPSSRLVKTVGSWISVSDTKLEEYAVELPRLVARNCRRDVNYVIACVQELSVLNGAALRMHQKISKRSVSKESEGFVEVLREGIDEIEEIVVAFNEFLAVD